MLSYLGIINLFIHYYSLLFIGLKIHFGLRDGMQMLILMANHYNKNEKDKICNGIIEQHYQSIYYYCYKKLSHDVNESKDCTQEVFYTLYKKMDDLRDYNKIGGWLYRTADNYIKKSLARKSFENRTLIHSMIDSDGDTVPECYRPYFSYEENDDLFLESPLNVEDCKDKILSALSSEEMTLWYLFFIENKSQKEISDILHISLPAVKSRVLRLKFKLNKQMEITLRDEQTMNDMYK